MGNKGLDVCSQQGNVNWAKVKASGIDFIIPRDGRGVDKDLNGLDYNFCDYVRDAQAAGISVPGVYHFIYVHNMDDALKNAQKAVENVRKAGLPQTTCIWCDQEEATVIDAVKNGFNLTTDLQRRVTEIFCDYVMSQGYPTGIYVNKDYIQRVYGESILKKYDIWLCDLSDGPDYPCVYQQNDWYARVNGIGVNVDTDVYYGNYTVGTARPKSGTETSTVPTTDNTKTEGTMKPKSKEYVNIALKVLDRPQGLNYKNKAPYNLGYCESNLSLSGDCWCVNPKATIWSMYTNDPICDNYTPGKYYYSDGIKASGLPDVTGDVIMNNYCEETTFRKMLESKKAPCLLLINGNHMGAYVGEFERDGKIYNVSEFSPNANLGGKMRSYVDEYGQRVTHKGGTVIGAWNRCGYLTSFLDYSDWNVEAPTPSVTPTVTTGGKIDKFVSALKEMGDGRYHYWDGSATGIGCSEYTRLALIQAGVINSNEYFHAGSGVVGPLADTTRFQRIAWSPSNLQLGDIMWSQGHHVATWDGSNGVYEAAPESTHGICDNGKTGVGHWTNHTYYNCGTGTNTWTCLYRIIDSGSVQPTPAPTPTPTPSEDIDATTLALQIYAGKWGNNPERKQNIVTKYGEDKYKAAQSIVDKIIKNTQWYKSEVQIAEDILANKYGNNPTRQQMITNKYGANAYRIAQGFVNSICNKDYTMADLKTAINIVGDILCGVYGNNPGRKQKIVAKYGETIYSLAQQFVNEILK